MQLLLSFGSRNCYQDLCCFKVWLHDIVVSSVNFDGPLQHMSYMLWMPKGDCFCRSWNQPWVQLSADQCFFLLDDLVQIQACHGILLSLSLLTQQSKQIQFSQLLGLFSCWHQLCLVLWFKWAVLLWRRRHGWDRWWQPWVWWTLLIGLHGYCGRLCWCLCHLSYLFALAFCSNLISSFTTILEFFSSFSSCFHSTWQALHSWYPILSVWLHQPQVSVTTSS